MAIFQAVGKSFNATLNQSVRATLTGIRILDPNGVVIASTGGELDFSLANRPEVKAALAGKHIWNVRHRKLKPGRHYIHYWNFFHSSNLKLLLEETPPKLERRADARVFVNSPIIVDNQVMGAVVASRRC